MKKGLLLGGLFAIMGMVRAQDIPVLPHRVLHRFQAIWFWGIEKRASFASASR